MQSYIPEINYDNMTAIEQAYWDLSDPALVCAPNFTAPGMSQIWSGDFIPIVCKEGDEIVGVMCIKAENNYIYYPVMKKGNQAEILASMCAFAQDNFEHLTAITENQFIHELAQKGGRPFTRTDNTLTWSK